MEEVVLEAEAVEEPQPDDRRSFAQPSRLPEPSRRVDVEAWRGEVRTAAIAAAGGLVAGAATVAAVRAVRSVRPDEAPARAAASSAGARRRRASSPAAPSWSTSTSSATAGSRRGGKGCRRRPPGAGLPRGRGHARRGRTGCRRRWRRRGDAGPRRDRDPPAPRRGRARRSCAPPSGATAPCCMRAGGGLTSEDRERAIERMRFALGVDDDYREVYEAFRSDRLFGSAIRQKPWHRPRRRPWAWEALAWSITKQLIESGARGRDPAPDGVPVGRHRTRTPTASRCATSRPPELIAGRAPAELAAMDLCAGARPGADPGRARGRRRPGRPGRPRRRPPAAARSARSAPGRSSAWASTAAASPTRCRRATSATSSSSAASPASAAARPSRRWRSSSLPYAPFRGLAGAFVLAAHHRALASGPPLRFAA